MEVKFRSRPQIGFFVRRACTRRGPKKKKFYWERKCASGSWLGKKKKEDEGKVLSPSLLDAEGCRN